MRGTLDPVTEAKIEAFAARRRRLILARGVCAVFTILLALMSLLALVDYFVLMADGLRWALSAAAYLAAAGAAWVTCARLIWRSPDAAEMARLFEAVRPELREDLLSAVELGDPRHARAWESEDFRETLQASVAERIRGVDVQRLLSLGHIKRWIMAGASVVGACVLLFLIPGLRYDHLLLRSLLPMANLERISRVRLVVREPLPPERSVPRGDVVVVRVETDGAEVKRALLETWVQGRKVERVDMHPAGPKLWESGIAVGAEDVRWRVTAGDGQTRWYTLSALPRPEAVAFHKTFTFPAYAKKPPLQETSTSGDLVQLEGSTAEVDVEVNQPVKGGELRLEISGKASALPLVPAGPARLRASIPLTGQGTYRVHLVAERTGFENKFSPQYEIRPMPDLVPKVLMEEPHGELIVPPDEVITVAGHAKDDLGLKVVAQAIRVNQGEWREWVLKEEPGAETRVSRRWELDEMKLAAGDRITTKLVAVDLKGGRAESPPVTIVVSAPGFDPQRHAPLAAKLPVLDALVALRDAVRALEKKIAEAGAASGEELGRKQALLTAAQDVEGALMRADEAEARLKDALRLARPGREGDDLMLVGRLVRRLKDAGLATSQAELEKTLKKADEAAKRASAWATEAEEKWRDLLAGEEAIAALNDLSDLARDVRNIHRHMRSDQAAGDPKTWERLARRQGVVVNQLETAVEGILSAIAQHAERGYGQRATKIREELQKAREALKKALEAAPGPALEAPSAEIRRVVEWAYATHAALELEIAKRAEGQRDRLEKSAEWTADDLRRAAQDLSLAKAARSQLEGRAVLEEARRDQDPFFVADAGLAGRAAQAVLEGHAASPDVPKTSASMRVVERAFRVLETGHQLAELAQALRELAENERFRTSTPDASTRQPKDWRWADERFKVPGLPPEIQKDLLRNVRGATGEQVREEMKQRSAPGRKPGPLGPSMERLTQDVSQAMSRYAPLMDQARKDLLKLVPSLHERLKILAEASETIQRKTGSLAEKTAAQEPAATRPEARQLLETQQSLDKQIEDVMAELRRDANTQDLFTEQGRERARDADDAVAMLQQAPPKAEDLLREAAAAPRKQAQEHALEKAAEQQGKLAEALKTLAKHYENVEKGRAEETRPELRKAEEALGIKPQLDAQYRQMERLADLAKQSPEALKAALSDELKKNEAMQKELRELTQGNLERAERALEQTAQMEKNAADALQQAAARQEKIDQQAKQGLQAEAKKLADEARRMAKEDVAKLSQPQAQAAQKDLNEGAQAAEQANKAALENAAKEFNDAAKDLQAAREAAQQAVAQAQQSQQKESNEAAKAQEKAKQEQAQADAAKKAAESAQQARKAAEQAAKAAQDGAAKQPQNADAQKQAQEAQQKAQQAQQKAQQAQANAQKEANEAAQAQQQAQAEAQQSQQAQQASQQAERQAQAAAQEMADAQQLAQRAQALAQQAAQAEAAASLAQQAKQLAAEAKRMAKEDVAKIPAPAAQAALPDLGEAAQAAAQGTPQGLEQAAAEFQEAARDLQQAAREAQGESKAAAEREAADAQQLAQRAQALAAQAKAGPAGQQLAASAQTQRRVGEMLQQAKGDLQQAAANQSALGQAEEAVTTSQVAEGVEGIRQNEVPAAAAAPTATQGAQGAQKAQAAIQKQSQALAKAKQAAASAAQESPADEGTSLSDEASEFLAQALNELNAPGASTPPPPGQGPPRSGQGQAPEAMAAAAQSQAQAMRQQRSRPSAQPGQPGQQASQSPFSQAPGQGKGAQVEAGPMGEGKLPDAALLKPGEWGKLPPKLARDLMEAQREGVSGEYRAMVETYFRVIAERARK